MKHTEREWSVVDVKARETVGTVGRKTSQGLVSSVKCIYVG